jgi:hypothetical protein
VLDFAKLRAREWANVLRPLPARLVSRAPDSHAADMHNLKPAFIKEARFVRLFKTFQDRFVHSSALKA